MIDAINALKRLFREPSAQEQARVDLQHAQRAQLEAHAQFEHAEAMVSYYRTQVARLQAYVQTDVSMEGEK